MNKALRIILTLLPLVSVFTPLTAVPDLSQTPTDQIFVLPGEDAEIDCVVKNLDNYTVLWKYGNGRQDLEGATILTANKVRLANDDRLSILHQNTHDTWILRISGATVNDSGLYACETNSIPPQRVIRFLKVHYLESENPVKTAKPPLSETQHNFTECCIEEKVASACVPYCSVQSLVSLKPSANVALTCFHHMQSMIKCLSDGRNHLPCCEAQGIPKRCQSACIGKYDLTTVVDHVQCLSYSIPILSCISDGVETLPPPPKDLVVSPLSTTVFKVTWKRPRHFRLVDHYRLNLTELDSFDETGGKRTVTSLIQPVSSIIIDPDDTEFIIRNLKPYTMYEIVMTSENRYGNSVPTNIIRVLTRPNANLKNKTESITDINIQAEASLLDLRKCCVQEGLKNETCLDYMCNPSSKFEIMNTKMLSCAPFANLSFKCLAKSYKKESECCRARGLSTFCQALCQPTASVDYRHAICFHYYPAYLSCYLENADALPSEPTNVTVNSVHKNWALIYWTPPVRNDKTVNRYIVYWKVAAAHDSDYTPLEYMNEPPFLLDKLAPNTSYEIYVTAVNKYGYSRDSSRVIFRTEAVPDQELLEVERKIPRGIYNETACCDKAGMSTGCLPLCSYNVKVNDILNFGPLCVDANTAQTLVRCTAGGRDHRTCCSERGVSDGCLSLCAGVVVGSPIQTGIQCGSQLTKILLCLKDGAGVLPGMPLDLYASKITKDSVYLHWRKSKEDHERNASLTYTIRYQKIKSEIPPHPTEYLNEINVTKESAILSNLMPSSRYSIHVVANNAWGSSLPSLVLIILTKSMDEVSEVNVTAKLGPPHSLEVVHQTYNAITLRWLPPLYVAPEASLSYQVYYRSLKQAEWKSSETYYSSVDVLNLEPNTNYAVKVVAKDDTGSRSHFSEVVVVRTDPIEPPIVSPPLIYPVGPIVSGSPISILCHAVGSPLPMVSILINGEVVRRHEGPSVWHNLTSVAPTVTSIGCYAVNGVDDFESEAAQESIPVRVHSQPTVRPTSKTVKVQKFSEARLECNIFGIPLPEITWLRRNQSKIVSGLETKIITTPHLDVPGELFSVLLLKRTLEDDGGSYTCKATNELGVDSVEFFLEVAVQPAATGNSLTDCCTNSQVKEHCMKACSGNTIDVDYALKQSDCVSEMGKLVRCSYNGKDNTECCKSKNVPETCRHWCNGESSLIDFCLIGSAKDILSCFGSGLNSTQSSSATTSSGSTESIYAAKPKKSNLFMVILFVFMTLAIALLLVGSMVYYHKVYKLRNSDNNNDDNIIGFENQTYLKDTDSVTLGTRQS